MCVYKPKHSTSAKERDMWSWWKGMLLILCTQALVRFLFFFFNPRLEAGNPEESHERPGSPPRQDTLTAWSRAQLLLTSVMRRKRMRNYTRLNHTKSKVSLPGERREV